MVYPFAAGSAADVLGRTFALRLSEILGQQVILENVGGAGGMIGSSRVAKAAPDGYQFVLGGTFMVLNQLLHKNPLDNVATDFMPVALIRRSSSNWATRLSRPSGAGLAAPVLRIPPELCDERDKKMGCRDQGG